jgi:hypothetical protein
VLSNPNPTKCLNHQQLITERKKEKIEKKKMLKQPALKMTKTTPPLQSPPT